MVTTSKMQTAEQSENYLEKEDYYQNNSSKGNFFSNSNKLLEHLGLEHNQTTNKELYLKLINGFNPKDDSALVSNAGDKTKRAGIDFCSSAPKSFSLLSEYARINNDVELGDFLLSMQKEANLRMMQEASRYALVRLSDAKRTKIDKVDIIWGSYNHNVSRVTKDGLIDPQEHIHNFIFNFAGYTDENGEYKTFTIEATKMMKMQQYLGNYYRNELAKLLIENGLEVELKDAKDGTFEIAGFTDEQIATFSNRSREIRETAQNMIDNGELNSNINKQKAIEIARLKNYKAKKEVNRDELTKDNAVRFEHAGLTDDFFSDLVEKSNPKIATPELKQEFLEKAYKFLAESKGVFKLEDLKMQFAKQSVHYGISLDEVDELIANDIEIVKLAPNKYTTDSLTKMEKFVIENLHNKIFNIDTSNDRVNEYLEKNKYKLTEGQENAVDLILNSENQFLAIQGDAGSGKTFSMKVLQGVYGKEFDFIGLAPTGKAGENLGNDANVESKTIDSYLLKEFDRNGKPRIILLDETGMVDSIKLSKLMESAIKNGDKLVMIGDTKQYMSIGAGKIFEDVQKYGIQKVNVTENKRQETEKLVEAVEHIKNGDVAKAFESLANAGKRDTLNNVMDDADAVATENVKLFEKFVIEKKNEKKLLEQIVNDYDEDSIILAPMNKQRNELNSLVREKRIANNVLDISNEFEVATFTNAKPNGVEKFNAKTYEIGQVLSIDSIKIAGFKAGQKFKIVGIKDDETLILDTISSNKTGRDRTRKNIEFNIKDNIDSVSIFNNDEKNPMKIGLNEKIIFTKKIMNEANKKVAIAQNGSMGIVKKIEGDYLTVELDNKKTIKFNAKENNFFDYAYAITDYKSQGMSIKKVQVLGDSMMANLNAFYVQITRAKQDLRFYTKNLEEFIERAKNQQFKESTLDYVMKADFRALEKKEYKNWKTDLIENIKEDRENIKFNLKKGLQNGRNNENVANNELEARQFRQTKSTTSKLDAGTRKRIDELISAVSVAIRGFGEWRESVSANAKRNWNKYREYPNLAGKEKIENLQKINKFNRDLEKKGKLFEALQIELQDKRDILDVYRDVFKNDKLTQNQIINKLLEDMEKINKQLENIAIIEDFEIKEVQKEEIIQKPKEKEISKPLQKTTKERFEEQKDKIQKEVKDKNLEITKIEEKTSTKKSTKKHRK